MLGWRVAFCFHIMRLRGHELCVHGTVVRKNCEPLESGPEIESRPGMGGDAK